MDTSVKERLIGAGILVALIVVLVPEMLSGPKQSTAQQPAGILPGAANNRGAVRTYTIDLSAPDPASAKAPPEQAPHLRETVTPTNLTTSANPINRSAGVVASTIGSEGAQSESLKPDSASPANQTVPPAAAAPAQAPSKKPDAPPVASEDEAPAPQGGWAVQLGSFANRRNAERLVKELGVHGYKAFIAASGDGARTRYKVRVGPEQDRVRANDLAQRLKREGQSVSVVASP